MRPRGVTAAILLLSVAACGDDAAAPGPGEPAAAGARAAPEGEGPPPGAPAPAGAAGLGLDPRRALVEPGLVGREAVCAVAFAERIAEVGPRERTRYPLPVTRRVAVQCASAQGRGWADLVLTEETAEVAEEIGPGRLVRVRVAAPDGGFAGYPILEVRRLEGAFEPPPPEPAPPLPEPGFDFARSAEPGVPGSARPCGVDFLGRLERLGDRERRLHPYPAGATHRIAVKCRHEGGDAWVDLTFDAAGAPRALTLRPGDRAPIRVLAAEGGYAGRPIGRLAEGGD